MTDDAHSAHQAGAERKGEFARGPLPAAPRRLPTLDVMRYAAVATLTALVVLGLVLFAIEIRTILLWILIGIVLAIGLQPAVTICPPHDIILGIHTKLR